jgi:hypothetical protein
MLIKEDAATSAAKLKTSWSDDWSCVRESSAVFWSLSWCGAAGRQDATAGIGSGLIGCSGACCDGFCLANHVPAIFFRLIKRLVCFHHIKIH